MKYVFFGTPDFAASILQSLIDAGMPPVAVVCNPDRPVGRKKIVTPPPTKQIAQKSGIEVFQPENKKELIDVAAKLSQDAEFGVVAAYAKLLPLDVLNSFNLGIIGVHPSLLPKYRGPSPVRSAILAGETVTGVSLYLIDEGMDTGPVLVQKEIDCGGKYLDTVMNELADLSSRMLVELLPKFYKGEVSPTAQDDTQATTTGFFETKDALVDEKDLQDALAGDEDKALHIALMVRALNPEPGVHAYVDGKRTKLLRASVSEGKLVLEEIQKEGKKPTKVI